MTIYTMKKIIVVIILLFLIAAGWWFYRNNQQKKAEIKTATVKRGNITKTVSASGKVSSGEEVDLKFQTSGQLAWVGVKEGESVKQWQAIAQLDTRELQKTLDKYLRDYAKERNDFEEERRITYQKLQIEEALTDTVKRILEKNQWDLEKAVLDVELKDLALKFSLLTTPISGIVTRVDTPAAGINITPATAVFQIANPDQMIFRANIDEADIAGIRVGLQSKITLDAYPNEVFEGLVTQVGFASVSTSGGGTAFPVKISLPKNDKLKFKIGLSGDVEIITESKENILVIPQDSFRDKAGKIYIWLIKNGKATKQEIKTGLSNNDLTEVLEGLKEGDTIVNSEVSKIKEGQKINGK